MFRQMKNKPIILILIIFLLCQAAVLAQEKESILDKKILLNNQITTLEQALKIIGREGDFTFSYGNKIPVGQEVVLKAGEYTVKEMLDVILRDIPVDYIVKKDKILLIPKKENCSKKTESNE